MTIAAISPCAQVPDTRFVSCSCLEKKSFQKHHSQVQEPKPRIYKCSEDKYRITFCICYYSAQENIQISN